MSFFRKLFGGRVNCSRCGNPQAKDSFAGIKCPSPGCPNCNAAARNISVGVGTPPPAPQTQLSQGASFKNPIELTYVNHANQSRKILGDRDTILDRGKYVSLIVAPKKIRISLRKDRISGVSPSDIAAAIKESQNGPSAKEAHILRYHKSMGTTSRRYEELQRRFPKFLG